MKIIDAKNVNDAWQESKVLLNSEGVIRSSRVGEMIEVPEPVTTHYEYPRERVLFDETRNCNPFFHFMESLWMLAGRNDVAFVKQFATNMSNYSDDGTTFHGAYGHRWLYHFEQYCVEVTKRNTQLDKIVTLLKNNKDERRAVLQMWDPTTDLGRNGVDLPCNTNIYFKIRNEKLMMTVCNRSNDIVWGCYGANMVHMSTLQEYMASRLEVDIGAYHQVSDSWHAYTSNWEKMGGKDIEINEEDPYDNTVRPYPLVKDPKTFDTELLEWIAEPRVHNPKRLNPIFNEVAVPMFMSWSDHKSKNYSGSFTMASFIIAQDWRMACTDWLNRRQTERESK